MQLAAETAGRLQGSADELLLSWHTAGTRLMHCAHAATSTALSRIGLLSKGPTGPTRCWQQLFSWSGQAPSSPTGGAGSGKHVLIP